MTVKTKARAKGSYIVRAKVRTWRACQAPEVGERLRAKLDRSARAIGLRP